MTDKDRILVIGAAGQTGTDIVADLRKNYGESHIIACDIRHPSSDDFPEGPFEILDVLDPKKLAEVISRHKINVVYHLAAILSASAEKKRTEAWALNINGLINVLEIAREKQKMKIFWPSTIAVFGPTTPRDNTPQKCIMEPTTVYGISKLTGERWCEYYFQKFNVDVRSVRYPGLIGYKAMPGGGTTDYAVDIFHEALRSGTYECFLAADTMLPMMYMPDALKATFLLMNADAEKIKIRSSYNIAGLSFTPSEIAEEIRKRIPGFSCTYKPDSRQKIADSWPRSIDDSAAKSDWGWKPDFNLNNMTEDMLVNLKKYSFHID